MCLVGHGLEKDLLLVSVGLDPSSEFQVGERVVPHHVEDVDAGVVVTLKIKGKFTYNVAESILQ